MSQHIKRLEKETGLALLERQPRGAAPAQAGRVLYHGALAGIASLPALPRLADPSAGPVRTVPIPALDPLTVGWAARRWNLLSPLVSEFADLVAASQ